MEPVQCLSGTYDCAQSPLSPFHSLSALRLPITKTKECEADTTPLLSFQLVIRFITRAPVMSDEVRDLRGGRQAPLSIEMLATWHLKYPRLDPVLTDLLARAVAFDHETWPSLAEMLATARVQAAQPGHGGDLGHAAESDAYVRGFLQNMLYDAVPDRPNDRGSLAARYNDPYPVISARDAGF